MNFNTDSLESGYFASELNIGGSTSCTFTCWARANSFNRGGIFEVGNSGTSQQMFALRTRDPGETSPTGGNNIWTTNHWGGAGDYTYTIANSLNNWTFFVVTYNTSGTNVSTTYAAVLDNDDQVTERDSQNMTLNLGDNLPFAIGRFDQSFEGTPVFFDGDIADVRCYSRVLDIKEMQTIFMSKGHDAISESLELRMPLRNKIIGDLASPFFVDSTKANYDGLTNVVEILGVWESGLSHSSTPTAKNRGLAIFASHNDSTPNVTLTSVTYGGIECSFINLVEVVDGFTNHIEMWAAGETQISAATSTTFVFTWSDTVAREIYHHAFFDNVNQVDTIDVSETATTTTSATISTSAITAQAGVDMICAAASVGESTTYTANNSFIEGLDEQNGSHTATVIYITSTGVDTPSVTTSDPTPNRQCMIAVEINVDYEFATIIQIGVPSHEDGDLLVLFVCPGGNSTGTPANVTTPGGWTLITNGDVTGAVSNPSLWIFRRTASSEPGFYSVTMNQECAISAQMCSYRNTEQVEDEVSALSQGDSTSILCPSVATVGDFLVLRFACGDDNVTQSVQEFFPDGVNIREYTQQEGNDASTGNGMTCGIGDEFRSNTPSNTRTFTLATGDEWAAFTVTFAASSNTLYQHGISPTKLKMIASDATGSIRTPDPLR